MSTMDHAAAHERIEDLLLEPARLAALRSSNLPEDAALREHLAGCPACAADLEAWRRVQAAVADALPPDSAAAAAAVEPVAPPAALRDRVLAGVRPAVSPGSPVRPQRLASIPRARRASRIGPWVGLAAAAFVLAVSGVITVDQVTRRAAAEAHAEELAGALAVVDRMLATDHKVVELRTTAGASAGTISWSRHDWVVLTGALAEPASGQEYVCWLETDGRWVKVGRMEFSGGTAYWVASLDEWQTWELGPTTTFVVTLEAVGADRRAGEPILEAALRS